MAFLRAEEFNSLQDWALLDTAMESMVLEKMTRDCKLRLAQLARVKRALRAVVDASEEEKDESYASPELYVPSGSAGSVSTYLWNLWTQRLDLFFVLQPVVGWPAFWDTSFVASLVFSKQSCPELQTGLMTLFNNNVLFSSLLLGAACSFIGMDYTGSEWGVHESATLDAVMELIAVLCVLWCACAALINICAATVLQSVPIINVRFWVKANALAISLCLYIECAAAYLFILLILGAGYAHAPFPNAYLAVMVPTFFASLAPLVWCGSYMPFLTSASGCFGNDGVVPMRTAHYMCPNEAMSVMVERASNQLPNIACAYNFNQRSDDDVAGGPPSDGQGPFMPLGSRNSLPSGTGEVVV
jgi:hypothetical protein